MQKSVVLFVLILATSSFAENKLGYFNSCTEELQKELENDYNPFVRDYAKKFKALRNSSSLYSKKVAWLNSAIDEVSRLRETSIPSTGMESISERLKNEGLNAEFQRRLSIGISNGLYVLLDSNTEGMKRLIGVLNTSCRGVEKSTDEMVNATITRLGNSVLYNPILFLGLKADLAANMPSELLSVLPVDGKKAFPFHDSKLAEFRMKGYITGKISNRRLDLEKLETDSHNDIGTRRLTNH